MKNKSLLISFLLLIAIHLSAQDKRIQEIISKLKDAQSKELLVVAHRGDWRGAPENSLLAIKGAIAMGVDIVEIDVQRTKDGHLIIMHDEKIDRTTNGKGYVRDLSLDSIKKLHLKNGLSRVTYHTVPTLEEAMLEVKGKVMVNLDKCYEYRNEAYVILEKTGTTDHAIFKGYGKNAEEVRKECGPLLNKIHYMAMVKLDEPGALKKIKDFQREIKPVAFELSFTQDTSSVFKYIPDIKKKGARVWINSLWASQNAGHDDDLAETNVTDSYNWIIAHGANIIQTDRPHDLLLYLKTKSMHQ